MRVKHDVKGVCTTYNLWLGVFLIYSNCSFILIKVDILLFCIPLGVFVKYLSWQKMVQNLFLQRASSLLVSINLICIIHG